MTSAQGGARLLDRVLAAVRPQPLIELGDRRRKAGVHRQPFTGESSTEPFRQLDAKIIDHRRALQDRKKADEHTHVLIGDDHTPVRLLPRGDTLLRAVLLLLCHRLSIDLGVITESARAPGTGPRRHVQPMRHAHSDLLERERRK